MWELQVCIPKKAVDRVIAYLENLGCDALSWTEYEEDGWSDERDESGFPVAATFLVSGYFRTAPDAAALGEELGGLIRDDASVVCAADFELRLSISAVDPDQDWQITWPPQTAGRFWIVPEDNDDAPPPGSIPVYLNPAMAFGSGEHPTTKGCLLALQELPFATDAVINVADIGTGSAILAIAAAKLWPQARIRGNDLDEIAVHTALRNCRRNGTDDRCIIALAAGVAESYPPRSFDIVTANILADPLCELADGIAAILKSGAYVVLSGFLEEHLPRLEEAYAQCGMSRYLLHIINGWCTLTVKMT